MFSYVGIPRVSNLVSDLPHRVTPPFENCINCINHKYKAHKNVVDYFW